MKKLVIAVAAAAAFAGSVPAMSLADASAKIGDAAKNDAVMAETVAALDGADQTAFFSKVVSAIDGMKTSSAEKAALYVNAAKAAVKSAAKSQSADMLAEVFATVPPEALAAVNEAFAADILDRNANAASPMPDEQYAEIATTLMKKIAERNEGSSDASVRNAFAALMFIRASGGTPAGLREALVGMIGPEADQKLAREEWLPAALAEGREKSYDSMLAVVDDAKSPDVEATLEAAATSSVASAVGDAGAFMFTAAEASAINDPDSVVSSSSASDAFLDANKYALPPSLVETGLTRKPKTLNADNPWAGDYRRGSGFKGSNTAGAGESGGYAGQTTR